MDFFSSSQNFVRALKSNSDPPTPGGPSKINIARSAWDQKSFYAPRKAEVIVDLILSRFLKTGETNSITDIQSWQLLLDVISPSQSTTNDSWLAPLVSRIPFTRIVIQLFESIQDSPSDAQSQLTLVASQCIPILWSFCVSKVTTDVLLECFGASLRLIKKCRPDEHLGRLITIVAGSFQRSVSASTTKKKIFTVFVQTHLEPWLSSLNQLLLSPALFECLYTSGTDCLLNLDVLRDSKSEAAMFSAFENIYPEIIMSTLPRFFSSYIHTLRRNRGAIFGQGSSQKLDSLEEFRAYGLRFFALCQPVLNKATEKGEAWKTKTRLLDVINQENLFSARHLEAERLLNGIVNSILVELGVEHQDTVGPAISCLSSLIRIDYLFVESVLPDILSKLLLIPDTVAPAVELLEIILQYHVKTRTVALYIDTLMSLNFGENIHGDDYQEAFERICHSAILHPMHLDRLGKCTHQFLPLNQTITAVRSVTERLKSLVEEYQSYLPSEEGRKARKRRKTDSGSGNDDSTNAVILTLSATAAFATVILSSFSAESVPKESQEELGTLLNDFSTKVVLHSLSKSFKDMSKNAESSSWTDEVAILANLRLRYALGLQRSSSISIDAECSSKLIRRMAESIEVVALPELRLEILRTLFNSMSEGQQPVILDLTLKILETTDISSGFSILHMVIQRWLPLVDLQASKEQLERFVVVLMNLQKVRHEESSAGILSSLALSSAEFWELQNVRNVLLAFIEQTTSVIDSWTTATLLQRQLVYSVFQTLLFVPTDYLSRPLRNSLVKRAILLDQAITASSDVRLLRDLRVSIARMLLLTDHSENLSVDLHLYLQHLHQDHGSIDIASETTELIRLLLRTLLKNGNSDQVLQLVKWYSENLQQSSFSTSTSWTRSFSIVVELLLKEHPLKNYSVPTQDAFKGLFNTLHARIHPILSDLISSPSAPKLVQAKELLEGWQTVLKLGRWLGLSYPVLGERVAQLFAYADASFVVFGVLLEEFNLCEASIRDQRLEIVIAAYALLARNHSVSSLKAVDHSISSMAPTLSPETFKHALRLILDSLRSSHGDEVNALIRLLTILLQDSPQNTFHIVQTTVTETINIFNDCNVFVERARLSALQLLSQRCRDRPATLRQLDISGIWLFIAKICGGAEVHDPTTSVETFHCIVTITTALVRLRRDLVLLTIPHLGIILRRLIQSMQTPRPNLGPKQSAMVSRGLPSWINTQEPLGVEESKALSRLLESLNTKTVIKKLTTSTTAPPKAESLAKPFSKHAAYVLKAYVESLNNPLCVLSAVVRKELQPGLYALCGMLNDYSRDALMASATDAGEKALVKALWREYEKQRYVGKG